MRRAVALFFSAILVGRAAVVLGEARHVCREQLCDEMPPKKHSRPERYRYAPVTLIGGSTFTLITPESWAPLVQRVSGAVISVHRDLSGMLGVIPPFPLAVRLLDEGAFSQLSGAPRWTQAVFTRGQILLSLLSSTPQGIENLVRSARHEYTHAVVHALSDGRCMGWLDEGLAQRAEGPVFDGAIAPLHEWLEEHPPIPLRLLSGGFTGLDPAMVAAAYGQSLVATNVLIDRAGVAAVRKFFDLLKSGEADSTAFQTAFSISVDEFEALLHAHLLSPASRSAPSKAR